MSTEENTVERKHDEKEGVGEEEENKRDTTDQPTTSKSAGAHASPDHTTKTKIDILLKPAGDAPIMKKKKWAVDREKKVVWISDFIKKFLKFEANESLFLYVNQSFSPSPDVDIGVLFDADLVNLLCKGSIDRKDQSHQSQELQCFGSDGKLVVHYCKTHAWG